MINYFIDCALCVLMHIWSAFHARIMNWPKATLLLNTDCDHNFCSCCLEFSNAEVRP